MFFYFSICRVVSFLRLLLFFASFFVAWTLMVDYYFMTSIRRLDDKPSFLLLLNSYIFYSMVVFY